MIFYLSISITVDFVEFLQFILPVFEYLLGFFLDPIFLLLTNLILNKELFRLSSSFEQSSMINTQLLKRIVIKQRHNIFIVLLPNFLFKLEILTYKHIKSRLKLIIDSFECQNNIEFVKPAVIINSLERCLDMCC